MSPDWSPDKKQIVFESNKNRSWAGERDIFIMNNDGSDAKKITGEVKGESLGAGPRYAYPAWSPDGNLIAYCKSGTAPSAESVYRHNIYVMNADGSEEKQITPSGGTDTHIYPKWLPDGDLAYLF